VMIVAHRRATIGRVIVTVAVDRSATIVEASVAVVADPRATAQALATVAKAPRVMTAARGMDATASVMAPAAVVATHNHASVTLAEQQAHASPNPTAQWPRPGRRRSSADSPSWGPVIGPRA
jgi:hypothetical protein